MPGLKEVNELVAMSTRMSKGEAFRLKLMLNVAYPSRVRKDGSLGLRAKSSGNMIDLSETSDDDLEESDA